MHLMITKPDHKTHWPFQFLARADRHQFSLNGVERLKGWKASNSKGSGHSGCPKQFSRLGLVKERGSKILAYGQGQDINSLQYLK